MKNLKAVYTNISWMFIYRLVKLGMAFIVTAWVARYLGAERYGTYMYAVGFAELCMLFWSQGLKEVIIDQTKKAGGEFVSVSVASFQLLALGNAMLYGLLAIATFLFAEDYVIRALVLICGLGIWFRSFEAFELYFHSQLNVKKTVKIQFISQSIYMVLNVALILFQMPLIWFGITYAIQLIIVGIGFVFIYILDNNKNISLNFNWFEVKRIVKVAKFMIFAKLTLLAAYLIDRILIEYLLDMKSVGYYTASMKMVTMWVFVASSISLSFIPVISERKGLSTEEERLSDMFGWITTGALLLVMSLALFSKDLVYLVFGKEYGTSIKVFQIIIWSLPFLFLNEGIKAWLVVKGQKGFYVGSSVTIIVLLICGNLLWTTKFGLVSAGVVFVLSWFIGGIVFFLFFKKTRALGIELLKSFLFPAKIIAGYINKN